MGTETSVGIALMNPWFNMKIVLVSRCRFCIHFCTKGITGDISVKVFLFFWGGGVLVIFLHIHTNEIPPLLCVVQHGADWCVRLENDCEWPQTFWSVLYCHRKVWKCIFQWIPNVLVECLIEAHWKKFKAPSSPQCNLLGEFSVVKGPQLQGTWVGPACASK